MKKLHSLAFYGLVTPVITFGAGLTLAQQSSGQDIDREQQSSQSQPGSVRTAPGSSQSAPVNSQSSPANSQAAPAASQSSPVTTQGRQNTLRPAQTGAQTAAQAGHTSMPERAQSHGYLRAAPLNGINASELIGVEVTTMDDEEVGVVSDLVIDDNGQIVGVVVGVGGFLGMGEKDVAIGWDDISRSSVKDDDGLQMNQTIASLRSAPEYVQAE